jgi:hypothetical protein
MDDNNAHGDIEIVATIIEQFPYLADLDLSFNFIFGKLVDFNFPSLLYLDFHFNMITGTIPDFRKIPVLQHLEIDRNELEGYIPDFSGLYFLKILSIGSSAKLSGTSKILYGLVFRQYLNHILGTLPDFSSLVSVENIGIYESKITGNPVRPF